jgi:XTP/dITP diphosphohydrolase
MQEQAILATSNPGKLHQIKPFFIGLDLLVRTLAEAGVEGEGNEDQSTPRDNAFQKAAYAHLHVPGAWSIAEDTSLSLRALGGQPGVRARRWAGENAKTAQITEYTLRAMEGKKDRFATFETVVALISPEGQPYFFGGKLNGHILRAARGAPLPGMPYSVIFVPEGSQMTLAELSEAEQARISHRGKAFQLVREFFQSSVLCSR